MGLQLIYLLLLLIAWCSAFISEISKNSHDRAAYHYAPDIPLEVMEPDYIERPVCPTKKASDLDTGYLVGATGYFVVVLILFMLLFRMYSCMSRDKPQEEKRERNSVFCELK